MKFTVEIEGREEPIEVERGPEGWLCRVNGQTRPLDAREVAPGRFSLLLDGQSFEVHVEERSGRYRVHTRGADLITAMDDPRQWRRGGHGGAGAEGKQEVTAPMPGKIVRVLVEEGQEVEAGDGLVVVEAMKMQNAIPSPKQGVVERVLVKPGDTVEHGSKLAVVS